MLRDDYLCSMPKTLISIIGPTAIGKTALSIFLAEKLQTEILSADSRQFYKEMHIGTAKPDGVELASAPHHFIGHLSAEEDYSAGQFEKDALAKLEELFQKHDTIIAVGGSGLYLKALWEGLDDFPEIPKSLREELTTQYEKDGLESLTEQLKTLDPEFYEKGEIQNPQRVIRALEVTLHSGQPFSSFKKEKAQDRDFRVLKIGLQMEREALYNRINTRVDKMLEAGLEEEARSLYSKKELNALQTVGYQEFFDYFDGAISREKAIELVKRNSRRYAKRQMTWFRKVEDIHWFSPAEKKQIFAFVSDQIAQV